MGKLEEALPLCERALAIFEESSGEDHPEVALAANNVGMLKKQLGHLDEALTLYQRALAINTRALGPDHPNVALSMNNLGTILK
eukprot:gene31767-40050_t